MKNFISEIESVAHGTSEMSPGISNFLPFLALSIAIATSELHAMATMLGRAPLNLTIT